MPILLQRLMNDPAKAIAKSIEMRVASQVAVAQPPGDRKRARN
jgi:hypothetical protein